MMDIVFKIIWIGLFVLCLSISIKQLSKAIKENKTIINSKTSELFYGDKKQTLIIYVVFCCGFVAIFIGAFVDFFLTNKQGFLLNYIWFLLLLPNLANTNNLYVFSDKIIFKSSSTLNKYNREILPTEISEVKRNRKSIGKSVCVMLKSYEEIVIPTNTNAYLAMQNFCKLNNIEFVQ